MHLAFKLDHLLPATFALTFPGFFTFIQGIQFLLPHRAIMQADRWVHRIRLNHLLQIRLSIVGNESTTDLIADVT